jgi:hypothetical protein
MGEIFVSQQIYVWRKSDVFNIECVKKNKFKISFGKVLYVSEILA